MKPKPKYKRRVTDMLGNDPVIPIKVETLFQDIKNDLSDLKNQITTLTDGMHRKADRTELEKLEDRMETLQRTGSDPAMRVEKEVADLRRRVDSLDKDAAKNSAVEENVRRLEIQERTSLFQWLTILLALLAIIVDIVVQVVKK
jgi:pilus assembly protein TadC